MKPEPPPNDEPDLIVSDLASSSIHPRSARELRPLLNGLSAVVAVVVVIVGVVWLHGQPQATSSTPATTPNLNGWRNVGLNNVGNIAFAASATTTAYACTQSAVATATGPVLKPITLQTSHDGGNSWRASITPYRGYNCYLSVDPTDAHDVILIASGCFGLCDSVTPPHDDIVRSYDAGAHWQPITFPSREDGAAANYSFGEVAWVKSTVFVMAFDAQTNTSNGVYLAAVPPHSSATWIDGSGLDQMIPPNYNLTNVMVAGSSIFGLLRDVTGSGCPTCLQLARSSDGGQSWHDVNPTTDAGQPITAISGTSAGTTLFGQIKDGLTIRLVRSGDGTHWQVLPTLPPSTFNAQVLWQTPDHSIYALLTTTTQDQVLFILPPNEVDWRSVVRLPLNGFLEAVSVDAQGHPLALWGIAQFTPQVGTLQRHT